ncbi:MAG: hypothetical protein FRX49_04166 [Trebouxia sp. A1-2]|nr:MAG: hypothetical protein FRX49_08673 [Trebouxia sp. A1-2]KAA6425791.1 MAG: hypothetical protein FRX49_04166 [Trebouxia sp. A1-2]
MAAAVLGTPPVSVSSHEEWNSGEGSTEEDAELLRLRDARLQQLKQDSQQRSALEPESHGKLTELSQAQSLVDAWLRKNLSNDFALNKASLTCDSDQDSEDDGDKPCSLCGRQYPHEHIRSVYTASLDDSDSDS